MNNTEIKTPLNYKIRKAVNPKNSPEKNHDFFVVPKVVD